MATILHRRKENVDGLFFVDSSCIDCDACRWIAPRTFIAAGDQAAVHHQPHTDGELREALYAQLACPTASIGTTEKVAAMKEAQYSFPLRIEKNVFYNGFHSEKSFGAASYFIQREGGNVLVDSPRFVPSLVNQFEAMGGIKYLYLTHRDDVAEHQRYHDHFGCERILHHADVSTGTRDIEIQPEGDEAFQFAPDLLSVPVPGHTRGSAVLLYQNFLFTGDHLHYSARRQTLSAFRNACWYSWREQTRSMHKLLDSSFEWVLPGHGRRIFLSQEDMQKQLQNCIQWMESA